MVVLAFCLMLSIDWNIPTRLEASDGKLSGICYGPFRANHDPDIGIFPCRKEMEEDIKFISNLTGVIRTYGSGQTPGYIPEICDQIGMECYLGIWLGKNKEDNRKEIEAGIKITHERHKSLRAMIVGSEVLLRKDLSEDELIAYINEVKERTKDIPSFKIAYAEIGGVMLDHPKVAESVNIIMLHIYSYWEGVSIENGAQYVIDSFFNISKYFPGKEIMIGETGWPSDGKTNRDAVPSEENQARFFKEFTKLAESNNIKYLYFEVFDEAWKEKFEGKVGACWGLYESNGNIKPKIKKLVPELPENLMGRPFYATEISVPFYIYDDAKDYQNNFFPSGYIGNTNAVKVDSNCNVNPHSGKTCICISYTDPKLLSDSKSPNRQFSIYMWSGLYLQFPSNNWGKYPGYKIKDGATALTFWARGENGGEVSLFKSGGIFDPSLPYHDSFEKIMHVVTLTKEWKKYSIDLKGKDLSNVIGGFCWVTNEWFNSGSFKIFVDEIKFE